MTLEEKFTELELQLTTQQTAVINALNAILEALGAPPPTATVTLATVSAQLTTMNTNIVAIGTANAGFYAALLDSVGLINVNTDTIITNNSLNAQRTIQAIYATFCECTTTTPLLPPVIDVTPTIIVDDAKCRRIQFYLSLFGTWLTSIANYGATGAAVTGGVLQTLLASAGVAVGLTATGAEVGAAGGIPGAVAGAVIGAIVGAIYAFGGNLLKDAATLYNSSPVQSQLLAEMYAASNADDGQAAFQYIISQNFDTIPAGIINFLWWSAWSNDIYSGSPVVDDSAFDGTICAPIIVGGCVTLTSNKIENNGFEDFYEIDPSVPYAPNPGPFESGDFNGYTVTLMSGNRVRAVNVSYYDVAGVFHGGSGLTNTGDTYTIPEATAAIGYYGQTNAADGHYTIELCEPE